jgi:hypothetical protein
MMLLKVLTLWSSQPDFMTVMVRDESLVLIQYTFVHYAL